MKHILAVIPTLFLIAVPAVSQTSQTQTVSEEIVVTASALPERVEETPASVTVITKDDIEARVARDVSDVLREVPGLTVARPKGGYLGLNDRYIDFRVDDHKEPIPELARVLALKLGRPKMKE